MRVACVYWLHFSFQTDIKTQGYVGITSWLKGRKHTHLKRLRLGTHQNPKLQAAYNAHGRKILFEVVKMGALADCIDLETELRPHAEIGLNLLPGGGMPPSQAGLPWFTNGEINVKRLVCPDGFRPGKTQTKTKPHASLGRPKSVEHRRNLSLANMGKKPSLATIEKIKARVSGLKRAKATCPHCGVVGGGGAMSRFHFDNCRRRA